MEADNTMAVNGSPESSDPAAFPTLEELGDAAEPACRPVTVSVAVHGNFLGAITGGGSARSTGFRPITPHDGQS